MIIINAVEGKKIHLGRIGENEARAVRFDISRIQAEFPGASISVLNMRPSDPDAYPVNGQYIALEGSYLLWTLQSGDLAEDGLGQCELKATLDGAIVKSIIWTTEICPALDGNGTPPEPWESWQQQVEDDADRAEAAAEDSEAWAVGERGGEPVPEGDETYHNNAKYWADQAEETLAGKADKVSGATNNHFAALDATGNLKDSGHADGDYARKTDTVLTTTLSRGRDATSQVGMGSLAFGDRVKATAPYSRANGSLSEASGMNAAAEGYDAKAAGQNAHAEGFHTRANNKDQHVFGAFNAPDPSTAPAGSQGRFIEIVGNGSSESNRSNARTLDWQGNERLKGDLYVGANADGTGGSKVAKVADIPEPVDISGKADKVAGAVAGNFAGLDENGNLTDSGSKASDFLTEHQDISGKADKVTGATNGNLAGLDGNGNLTDSGKKAADFVPVTSFRADAMPMSATDPKTVAQTATELKSAIQQKADIIRDSVTNVPIATVPDGAAVPLSALQIAVEPVQDLHGYANPYPGGASPQRWDEEWELGGINGTNGENSGETDRIRSKNYIAVEPNTEYYFLYSDSRNAVFYVCEYDTNKGFIQRTSIQKNNTFTTGSGCYFIRFFIYSANSITTYANNISINYPSTDTSYHHWANICPITGRTGAVVAVTGKNLFDKTIGTTDGIRGDDGTPSTSTASGYTDPIGGFEPETQYTIQGTIAGSTGNWRIYYLDKNGGWISRTAGIAYNDVPKTFTTPANCRFIQIQFIRNGVNKDTIQIEKGSTATPYTAYTGKTYPISWQTEAGTVYGGTLTVNADGSMELIADVAKKSVSANDITNSSGALQGRYFTGSNYLPGTDQSVVAAKLKCNSFKAIDLTSSTEMGVCYLSNTFQLIFNTPFASIDDFKSYITSNPIEIIYGLATPIEIDLSELEVIETLKGINNLWADCGNILLMEYGCDTKGYIDKKLAELTALILEN